MPGPVLLAQGLQADGAPQLDLVRVRVRVGVGLGLGLGLRGRGRAMG